MPRLHKHVNMDCYWKKKTMCYNRTSFLILIIFACYSCSNNSETSESTKPEYTPTTPVINYSVTNYFPHDTTLFTEGFLIHNGEIFESTGSPEELPNCKSLIGISSLSSGKFEKKIELDKSKYFGEGIVFLKNRLYQLTYKNQTGFIYDEKSFKRLDSFKYQNKEGWSLTTDGTNLIMSDGTDNLTFLNPSTLKPVRTLRVSQNGYPRDSINELEYIKGFIYANIWINNSIVKIDPTDGKVIGKLDLSAVTYEALNKNPTADVLNGIAYDSLNDKIYVTGKKWANIYQIDFAH